MMEDKLSALADILLRAGWTSRGDAQWTNLAEAVPSIAALLAPDQRGMFEIQKASNEKMRDEGLIASRRAADIARDYQP